MLNHRPFTSAAMAIGLLGACINAQASDGAREQLTSSVGRWIAAQGNAALDQLQHDLRRDLIKKFRPMLPQAASMDVDPIIKVNDPAATKTSPDHPQQSL